VDIPGPLWVCTLDQKGECVCWLWDWEGPLDLEGWTRMGKGKS
jgi:hypothetical protein